MGTLNSDERRVSTHFGDGSKIGMSKREQLDPCGSMRKLKSMMSSHSLFEELLEDHAASRTLLEMKLAIGVLFSRTWD